MYNLKILCYNVVLFFLKVLCCSSTKHFGSSDVFSLLSNTLHIKSTEGALLSNHSIQIDDKPDNSIVQLTESVLSTLRLRNVAEKVWEKFRNIEDKMPIAAIEPKSGPIGEPISITLQGIGFISVIEELELFLKSNNIIFKGLSTPDITAQSAEQLMNSDVLTGPPTIFIESFIFKNKTSSKESDIYDYQPHNHSGHIYHSSLPPPKLYVHIDIIDSLYLISPVTVLSDTSIRFSLLFNPLKNLFKDDDVHIHSKLNDSKSVAYPISVKRNKRTQLVLLGTKERNLQQMKHDISFNNHTDLMTKNTSMTLNHTQILTTTLPSVLSETSVISHHWAFISVHLFFYPLYTHKNPMTFKLYPIPKVTYITPQLLSLTGGESVYFYGINFFASDVINVKFFSNTVYRIITCELVMAASPDIFQTELPVLPIEESVVTTQQTRIERHPEEVAILCKSPPWISEDIVGISLSFNGQQYHQAINESISQHINHNLTKLTDPNSFRLMTLQYKDASSVLGAVAKGVIERSKKSETHHHFLYHPQHIHSHRASLNYVDASKLQYGHQDPENIVHSSYDAMHVKQYHPEHSNNLDNRDHLQMIKVIDEQAIPPQTLLQTASSVSILEDNNNQRMKDFLHENITAHQLIHNTATIEVFQNLLQKSKLLSPEAMQHPLDLKYDAFVNVPVSDIRPASPDNPRHLPNYREKSNDLLTIHLEDAEKNSYVLSRPSDTQQLRPDFRLIVDITIMVCVTTVGGFLAEIIRTPTVLGQLVGGIIVGPHCLNKIDQLVQLHSVAQLGSAFILFELGLHFSFKKILKVRQAAIYGGLIAHWLFLFIFLQLAIWRQTSISESLIIACYIVMSSTAICSRDIASRRANDTHESDVAIGILLVQDGLLGLISAFIPMLNPRHRSMTIYYFFQELLSPLIYISILILIGCIASFLIFPRCLTYIKMHKSSETFLLFCVLILLGTATLSEYLQLSLELGAFCGGLMMSRLPNNMQESIDLSMEALKNLWGPLFFASIGLLLDPFFVWDNLPEIFNLLCIFIGLKFTIFFILLLFCRYHWVTALRISMMLSHLGEFGFVILGKEMRFNILTRKVHLLLLGTTGISLVLAPLFLGLLQFIPNGYNMYGPPINPTLFSRYSYLSVFSNKEGTWICRISQYRWIQGLIRCGIYLAYPDYACIVQNCDEEDNAITTHTSDWTISSDTDFTKKDLPENISLTTIYPLCGIDRHTTSSDLSGILETDNNYLCNERCSVINQNQINVDYSRPCIELINRSIYDKK